MSRAARIEAEYGDQVRAAAERFGDHEDMSVGRVLKWVCQFADEHLPLALRLLERIRYYNTLNVRTLSRQLVEIVGEELPAAQYPSIAIVPAGGPGSGAMVMSRVFREAIVGRHRYQLVDMLKLAQANPGKYSAVVFVDDFSGTGNTLQRWWATVEPIVRPLDAEVVVALLVLNYRARQKVQSISSRVLCIDELDHAADVFDNACAHFAEDQGSLLEYAKRTRCSPIYKRGYGDCGLILSFRHGCPNNSIPTLWHESEDWKSLFMRRAV